MGMCLLGLFACRGVPCTKIDRVSTLSEKTNELISNACVSTCFQARSQFPGAMRWVENIPVTRTTRESDMSLRNLFAGTEEGLSVEFKFVLDIAPYIPGPEGHVDGKAVVSITRLIGIRQSIGENNSG